MTTATDATTIVLAELRAEIREEVEEALRDEFAEERREQEADLREELKDELREEFQALMKEREHLCTGSGYVRLFLMTGLQRRQHL
jgi:hypothetical protein